MLDHDTKIVVVDLDGTLYNDIGRKHLVEAGLWDDYHRASIDDEPWPDVLAQLGMLSVDVVTVACTGRNVAFDPITRQWMEKHDAQIDHLIMRPNGNYLPDHELKPQLLSEFFQLTHEELQEHVLFILEDRDKVVDAWRSLGYRCWQVQPGGF